MCLHTCVYVCTLGIIIIMHLYYIIMVKKCLLSYAPILTTFGYDDSALNFALYRIE